MMKYCKGCNTIKNYDQFVKDRNRADGHIYRCKECTAKKQRTKQKPYKSTPHRNIKRRKQYGENEDIRRQAVLSAKKNRKRLKTLVDELKGNICFDCKSVFPSICLDFDHLDGFEKTDDIWHMVNRSYSIEHIKKEIIKCEVVCSNCHRIRTKNRYGKTFDIEPISKDDPQYKIVIHRNRQKRIKNEIDNIKAAPCTDCKRLFPSICMDFDHIVNNKTKEVAIMVVNGTSIPKILIEIAKCQLVCSNCHRIRTDKRMKTLNK